MPAGAGVVDPRRNGLGELVRDAIVEAIPEILRVCRPGPIVGHEGALIPDLHAVRPGDVRHCPFPRVRPGEVRAIVLRPVDDARSIAIREAAGRTLFGHLDQIVRGIRDALEIAPSVIRAPEACLQQQPVGERRRPRHLRHSKRQRLVRAVRFRRDDRWRRDPDRVSVALPAHPLLVPERADLVALAGLPGQASADVLPRAVGESLLVQIRRVEPFVGIARVQVDELIDVRSRASLRPCGDEVPDAILLDRAAGGRVQVVHLEQRRRHDAGSGGVVGLQVLAAAAVEQGSLQRVAAGLRDDVHHQSGGFRFAEAARSRERDLLRVADVNGVARGLIAARRVADVETVNGHAPFVVPAAMDRELRGGRAGCHVVRVGDDAGHDDDDGVVTANRRDGLEHVVAHHRLAPSTLDVHDRALAGDGHRLRQAADLQFPVDRRGERPRQLDPFALGGAETLERECDRISAGPQVFDAVLSRAVGDRRSHFFNQRRTGGLDGHTREHRSRRVLH